MIFHLKLLRAISAMICHQLFKEKHVTTSRPFFVPSENLSRHRRISSGTASFRAACLMRLTWPDTTTGHDGHGDLKFQIPQPANHGAGIFSRQHEYPIFFCDPVL